MNKTLHINSNKQLLFVVISLFCLLAQDFTAKTQTVGVGEWRFHLSYRQGRALEKVGDRIYCGTRNGLFYVTPEDRQIHPLSPLDGFSGTAVTAMKYAPQSRHLLIAYENGMLDVIKDNEIQSFSAIAQTQIIGTKQVNAIKVHNKMAYLSCSFGVIEFDLRKLDFGATYFGPKDPGLATYGTAFTSDSIYVSSENGLLSAPLNQGYNLKDPSIWQTVDSNTGGPVGIQQDWLYTKKDSSIVKYNTQNPSWSVLNDSLGTRLFNIEKTGEDLFIAAFDDSYRISPDGTETLVGESEIQDLFYDDDGVLWLAHDRISLISRDNPEANLDYYSPNGPQYKDVWSGTYSNGNIYVTGGGLASDKSATYNIAGYYVFKDNGWQSYNINTSDDFAAINLRDVLNIAISPVNGNAFIASYLRSLVETNQGEVIQRYTDTNSKLKPVFFSDQVYRVPDVKFDGTGNLWVTNNLTDEPLAVKTNDNQWYSYELPSNEVLDIEIDDAGHKWVQLFENGVVVFDDNGTLANKQDDRVLQFTNQSNRGNLPSGVVNDVTKDEEGDIWLGTNDGIAVFFNAGSIFSRNDVTAQQIFIEDNGDGGYLLSGESVNAIAVDGANDKWMGTDNGVWHVAADGSEILKHFTKANSPLLSNRINDIVIHQETGEAFFLTEEGIISYRGEATKGGTQHNDVYAFPNPVKPGYSGPITIKGLVSNANVKITDINNNLVTEMKAKGGQAVWDRKNLNGNVVRSGVYLVYSSGALGEETFVTKIMIISQ